MYSEIAPSCFFLLGKQKFALVFVPVDINSHSFQSVLLVVSKFMNFLKAFNFLNSQLQTRDYFFQPSNAA